MDKILDQGHECFYTFKNRYGREYVFSGNSGYVMERDEDIDAFLRSPHIDDPEYQEYFLKDHFKDFEEGYYKRRPYINFLTVFTTNGCNLKCSYCYEKAYSLEQASSMSLDTFKKGIEFFLDRFEHDQYFSIQFFGGEPLLKSDFIGEAIIYLKGLERQRDIRFLFSIITNGTLLDDKIKKMLIKYGFGVTISIDGSKELHDKNRIYHNNEGSYDKIMKNVQELSKYLNITARLTLTDPKESLKGIYETMIENGFSGFTFDMISKPTYEDFDFDALSKNLWEFADYFIENFKNKKLIQNKKLLYILYVIHNGARKGVRYLTCGAGSSYYTLASNGDIYPCHRLNNNKSLCWGNIDNGLDTEKRSRFLNDHLVFNRDQGKCSKCWARYLCGGTCYENAFIENSGDTLKNSDMHCRFTMELIKTALYVYASIDENGLEVLDRLENL